MFTLTDEFARAQYDYTRERISGHARPRVDAPDGRRRRSVVAALFKRRLRPSLPHG
jgi:hypothetical protein